MNLPPPTPSPAAGGPGTQLVLVPPEPVAPVAPEQAGPAVAISAEVASRLSSQAVAFADALVGIDPSSPGFTSKVAAVHRMGEKEIRASAAVSNRLLDKPTRAMNSGAFDATSSVSTSLVELRRVIDDLDPSKVNLLGPKKLLGMIPFGNRLRDYFASYQSSQTHLDAILHAMQNGQEELRRDNAAIEQEKHNLWTTMSRLREYAQLASDLDAELVTRIDRIEAADPDRARTLREDVLFYVRQKHQDLLTQLAVSAQGYLALDMIRRNNLELIKGVDRASTTTVAALRTAVLVAQALANQKLVLDQIAALNQTTERLIVGTSELLRRQTVEIHGQAASSTVSVQALQQAFANIYATIDTIDGYKTAALETMRTTVTALSQEVGKAAAYLDRAASTAPVEIAPASSAAGELEISGGGP
ncbi:toxic anion resistance protein [Frankia sp. Cas3]|uniref:toxic anion resistance protein n=1 Tax=Frankia sp. Cas3 TaxID=3073926 RepID=UPI002AD45D03|nr:toxic anion resistance protein [Frankia sp. Cas3]